MRRMVFDIIEDPSRDVAVQDVRQRCKAKMFGKAVWQLELGGKELLPDQAGCAPSEVAAKAELWLKMHIKESSCSMTEVCSYVFV